MKKHFIIIFYFVLLIITTDCQRKQVLKTHGIAYLENKHQTLNIKTSNKNDARILLGNPSSIGVFDETVWIYIERKTSTGSIYKLGKSKLLVNNVLVLEINKMGLLASKKFYDKKSMNDIEIAANKTDSVYGKRSFVYDFLSSMRQKINDPLGNREKRLKKN